MLANEEPKENEFKSILTNKEVIVWQFNIQDCCYLRLGLIAL